MKNVFVTGGSGSVGQAIVSIFAEAGYHVDFQFLTSKSTATDLEKRLRVRGHRIDFSQEFEIPDLRVDILINNTGINITRESTENVSLEDWQLTLLVNTTVPFMLIRKFLPTMKQNKWGRIINVSSIYGLRGCEHNLPYTVSKHALSGLTKSVAREVASYGITSNEVCPGPIESSLMNRIAAEKLSKTGLPIEKYFEQVNSEIPQGRMACPREVADACLFLASEGASYVNGASLVVDGGLIT